MNASRVLSDGGLVDRTATGDGATGHGAQSPGDPGEGGGTGPDGGWSPAQIVRRPHERSTLPIGKVYSTTPSATVVSLGRPGATLIEVSTRPLGDLASTVHGNRGSDPGSIVGGGAPGG